jgi:alpha-galactosidase
MDMLEVGNGGMTDDEYRIHFTFWAALKSPLILGNKLKNMDLSATRIIGNEAMIAVNQDALGKPAMRRWKKPDGTQMWAGELVGGYIVILYNKGNEERDITATFEDVFLDEKESSFYEGKEFNVIDLWAIPLSGRKLVDAITDTRVSAHSVRAYKIITK